MPPKKFTVIIAFAALYIIWGSTYLGIRFAIATIPPFLMAGVRYFLAGVIMYSIARFNGAPRASLADWKTACIVGACLLLGGNGGVTISEKYISSGLAALMVATVPIYMTIFGWLMKVAPRPGALAWSGLAGGFLGVGILVGPVLKFSPDQMHHQGTGMLILLVSSFIWSIGSLYSRRVPTAAPPFLAAGQQMLCGGVLLVLAGIATGEQRDFHWQSISATSLWAFAYLVIIGALVGFTAYIWLLRNCEPTKVATYAYVNPIVAVILGAIFAGETLNTRMACAAALIIGSVAIVITAQQFKPRGMPPIAAAVPSTD